MGIVSQQHGFLAQCKYLNKGRSGQLTKCVANAQGVLRFKVVLILFICIQLGELPLRVFFFFSLMFEMASEKRKPDSSASRAPLYPLPFTERKKKISLSPQVKS